jgi:hypothetical protein
MVKVSDLLAWLQTLDELGFDVVTISDDEVVACQPWETKRDLIVNPARPFMVVGHLPHDHAPLVAR